MSPPLLGYERSPQSRMQYWVSKDGRGILFAQSEPCKQEDSSGVCFGFRHQILANMRIKNTDPFQHEFFNLSEEVTADSAQRREQVQDLHQRQKQNGTPLDDITAYKKVQKEQQKEDKQIFQTQRVGIGVYPTITSVIEQVEKQRGQLFIVDEFYMVVGHALGFRLNADNTFDFVDANNGLFKFKNIEAFKKHFKFLCHGWIPRLYNLSVVVDKPKRTLLGKLRTLFFHAKFQKITFASTILRLLSLPFIASYIILWAIPDRAMSIVFAGEDSDEHEKEFDKNTFDAKNPHPHTNLARDVYKLYAQYKERDTLLKLRRQIFEYYNKTLNKDNKYATTTIWPDVEVTKPDTEDFQCQLMFADGSLETFKFADGRCEQAFETPADIKATLKDLELECEAIDPLSIIYLRGMFLKETYTYSYKKITDLTKLEQLLKALHILTSTTYSSESELRATTQFNLIKDYLSSDIPDDVPLIQVLNELQYKFVWHLLSGAYKKALKNKLFGGAKHAVFAMMLDKVEDITQSQMQLLPPEDSTVVQQHAAKQRSQQELELILEALEICNSGDFNNKDKLKRFQQYFNGSELEENLKKRKKKRLKKLILYSPLIACCIPAFLMLISIPIVTLLIVTLSTYIAILTGYIAKKYFGFVKELISAISNGDKQQITRQSIKIALPLAIGLGVGFAVSPLIMHLGIAALLIPSIAAWPVTVIGILLCVLITAVTVAITCDAADTVLTPAPTPTGKDSLEIVAEDAINPASPSIDKGYQHLREDNLNRVPDVDVTKRAYGELTGRPDSPTTIDGVLLSGDGAPKQPPPVGDTQTTGRVLQVISRKEGAPQLADVVPAGDAVYNGRQLDGPTETRKTDPLLEPLLAAPPSAVVPKT